MEINTNVKFYTVPLTLDIILYRNNYLDNLIISELKKNARLTSVSKNSDSFTVPIKYFKRMLKIKFKGELKRIGSISNDNLSSNVNSAYFLNNLVSNFNNLISIKVNVSNKRNFSRVFETDDQKMIGFEYKVTTGLVDYSKYMDKKQLKRFNKIMRLVGILDDSLLSFQPYIKIRAQAFLLKISSLEVDYPDLIDSNMDILDIIYDLIEAKIEDDDTILIIKTDYSKK